MRSEILDLLPEGAPNFWVEVWDDDDIHYIRISRHSRFDPALAAYERLVKDKPSMRVLMRHRAHIYRNYIPERLHNRYGSDRDYSE